MSVGHPPEGKSPRFAQAFASRFGQQLAERIEKRTVHMKALGLSDAQVEQVKDFAARRSRLCGSYFGSIDFVVDRLLEGENATELVASLKETD